jgi:hypothetical protein
MQRSTNRLPQSRTVKPLAAALRRPGRVLAGVAALALAATALATAGPAQAATTYREYANNSSQFKLVMTARGTAVGSPVGLSVDNDDRFAQWRREFLSTSADGRPVYRYIVRASEPANKCLDVKDSSRNVGAAIVVRPCDGRASQRWASITSNAFGGTFHRFRNENSGLFVARTPGPEFITNLIQNKANNGGLWTPRVSLTLP